MQNYPKYLSASGLDTYTNCPKRYYYSKVAKLPEPPVGDAARVGTLIHSVMEEFYSLPADNRSHFAIQNIAEDQWDKFKISDSYMYIESSDEEVKTKVKRAVDLLFEIEIPSNIDVVAVEMEIRTEVGGAPIFGYIDRIERGEDDSLIVTDFKFGKYPASTYHAVKIRQPMLYAAALKTLGETVSKVQLIYGATGDVIERPVTERSLEKITERFVSVWNNIVAGNFPEKTGPLCAYCPFEALCPKGQWAADRYRQKRLAEGRPI